MFQFLKINLIARVSTCLLFLSLFVACSNVKFSTNDGKPGTGLSTGTPTTGNGTNGDNNTAGDDGNAAGGGGTPGGGSTVPGNDGTTPGSPTSPPPSGPRDVSYALTIPAAKNQVDFLLVIDNSASMIALQQKLASSMTALTTRLNALNVDWQMCLTTTTDMNMGGTPSGTGSHTCTGPYCTGTYTGGTWHWGVSLPWANGSYVLNKTRLAAAQNIFNDSIPRLGAGDSGTGDERGVKAAYNHFANWKASSSGGNNIHNTKDCYRPGSAVAVILLSDEDERSVAGDCSRVNTALGDKEIPACRHYHDGSIRTLEFQDLPSNLVSQANAVFGDATRFTFNSIIADTDACQAQLNQNISFVKDGISYYSPHYTGTIYRQASELTQGGITSLCSTDLKLNLLSEVVVNKLDKLSLECAPAPGSLQISVNGVTHTSHSVSGAVVTFNPALVENQTVTLNYRCLQ